MTSTPHTPALKDDPAFSRNFSGYSVAIADVAYVFERDALMDVADTKMHEYEVGQFYRLPEISGRDRVTAFETALRTAARLQWQSRYSTRGTRFYAVRVGTMMLVMRHIPKS